MDRPCDKFLADPGLPLDQDRHVRGGHLADLVQNVTDRVALSDDLCLLDGLKVLQLQILILLFQLLLQRRQLVVRLVPSLLGLDSFRDIAADTQSALNPVIPVAEQYG